MTWKNNLEIEELKQYIGVLLGEQYKKNEKHNIEALERIDAMHDIYVYIKYKQRQEKRTSQIWAEQENSEWLNTEKKGKK